MSIQIPQSVVSIGDYAFTYCSGLVSISLPSSLESVGSHILSGCWGITEPVYASGFFVYCPRDQYGEFNLKDDTKVIAGGAFKQCEGITSVGIPGSVNYIGDEAFWGCSNIKEILIPNDVSYIGESAFRDCGLTSFRIPDSVSTIAHGTFYDCQKLASVTIPNSVTTIGSHAFHGCKSLESIEIPNSVVSLGEEAFSSSGLTAFDFPGSVTSIGVGTFWGCSSLKYICIPNTVKSIGTQAFLASGIEKFEWNCNLNVSGIFGENYSFYEKHKDKWDLVKELVIGNDVTDIYGTFTKREKLETITLGKKVCRLRNNAFQSVPLKELYVTGYEMPYCYSGVFNESKLNDATLYVHKDNVEYCKNNAPWNLFGKIEGIYTNIDVSEIIITPESVVMTEGTSFSLQYEILPSTATNKHVVWSSDDTSIAVVDETGVITAKAAGTTTIKVTASDGSGVSAICAITVKPTVKEITLDKNALTLSTGETYTLVATISPADVDDKTITWASSNEDVALVNSEGKVVALDRGEAVVTATASNGVKAICNVTVANLVKSIELNASDLSMEAGDRIQLIATVLPENADVKTVTWSSSDDSKVMVSSNGIVVCLSSEGSAIVTATANDTSGIFASCIITCTTSIDDVVENGRDYSVYTLTGVKVLSNITSISSIKKLPAGIYVVNGKKVYVKP